MNKKRLIILLSILILTLVLAGFLWWALIRPSLVDDVVNEAAPITSEQQFDEQTPQQRASDQPTSAEAESEEQVPAAPDPRGNFAGVDGHEGAGSVVLLENTLRLEENFSVTNGPDLYVYVGDENQPLTQVARLKGNVGSQNYDVSGIDVAAGQYIWIYCVAFDDNFAKAQLQ